MKCSCGNRLVEVLVDVERKADGKVAECIVAEHCEECDTYYVNFGGITFE